MRKLLAALVLGRHGQRRHNRDRARPGHSTLRDVVQCRRLEDPLLVLRSSRDHLERDAAAAR